MKLKYIPSKDRVWPRLCKNNRKYFEFNDDGTSARERFVPTLIATRERVRGGGSISGMREWIMNFSGSRMLLA
jgi:hypothetical protein